MTLFTTPPLRVIRPSPATYIDPTGTMQTVAANVARWQNGVPLIEAAATNSIRNSTMAGAVPGTPGTVPTDWAIGSLPGITTSVIGTGSESGIPYIDVSYVGTPSTTANLFLSTDVSVTTIPGQSYFQSMYVRLVGGSLTNVVACALGGIGFIIFTPTGASLASQRVLLPNTASGSTTQPYLFVYFTNGQPINLTLRIGAPQFELGTAATSFIPTTNAAMTRAADVAVSYLGPLYGRSAFAATDMCENQAVMT